MTVSLSDYDQALLEQVAHFGDAFLAEQVRAVMVARDNAERRLADTHTELRELCDGSDGIGFVWVYEIRRALLPPPQPEPDPARLIDPELAHGWESSEKEMRKLRADLAAERDGREL
jgi:hypothetical protein